MEVAFRAIFLRQVKKLPLALQEEVIEMVELFKDSGNHARLRVHKLKGRLKHLWSFSVNYEYRILFEWETKNKSAILLAIGTHEIYNK